MDKRIPCVNKWKPCAQNIKWFCQFKKNIISWKYVIVLHVGNGFVHEWEYFEINYIFIFKIISYL